MESTEAPVSMNFKVSYKGVNIQITNREIDAEVKPLLNKAKIAIDWALSNGFEIEVQRSFPKKEQVPLVYADYPCPSCGNKVVQSTTKTGKKLEKCETQKFVNGVTTGCAYTKWLQ